MNQRRVGIFAWLWRFFFGEPSPRCAIDYLCNNPRVWRWCHYGHCHMHCERVCRCKVPALPATPPMDETKDWR